MTVLFEQKTPQTSEKNRKNIIISGKGVRFCTSLPLDVFYFVIPVENRSLFDYIKKLKEGNKIDEKNRFIYKVTGEFQEYSPLS